MDAKDATINSAIRPEESLEVPRGIIFIHCIWFTVLIFTLGQYLRKKILGNVEATTHPEKKE